MLVEAYTRTREQLAALAALFARNAVAQMTPGDWYSPTRIGSWARALLLQVRAVQRQTAAATDAYLTRTGSTMTGRSLTPAGTIDVLDLRGARDMLEVYGRPADQYRYARSQGADEATAVKRATERAVALASDDVDLAMRAQSTHTLTQRHAIGYRRVIHPELPTMASLKAGDPPPPVCGLCVAASTRLYGPTEPMPIHDNCRCVPMGLYEAGDDVGGAINDAALKLLYAQAGNTTDRQALSHTRYSVHTHGELGPVLRLHGEHFDGPRDIALRSTH